MSGLEGRGELDSPVDPLDRALFSAGRRETMPQATRDALLAAAAAGTLAAAGAGAKTASAAGAGAGSATPAALAKVAAWKWALLGALAIGGAGTAALYAASRSGPPAEVRVAETPAVVTPSPPPLAPTEDRAPEAPVEEAPAVTRPQPSAPRLSKTPPVAPASSASPAASASDLAAEAGLLDEARAALAAGEAARALTLLDRHRRDYPTPELRDEAFVLRVEALSKQGDHAAVRRLAEPWLAANPKSPHAARVRRALARAPESASP